MKRGPDFSFQALAGKPTLTALPFKGAAGATVAPDGTTYFIDADNGPARGGWLVSQSHPKGIFLAVGEVHEAVFSPDGLHLALENDETSVVRVVSVPEGKAEQIVGGAYAPVFLGNGLLVYKTRCELMQVVVTTPAKPTVVAKDLCGAGEASRDGATWMIVSPSKHPTVLSMRTFLDLQRVDAKTGKVTTLLHLQPPDGFEDPQISPRGDRACMQRRGKGLSCIALADGREEPIAASGSAYKATFDLEGNQLLYPVGGQLEVADFRTWTVRKLFTFGEEIRYWRFFPGGKRIITYQNGATVHDLEAQTSFTVQPSKVEVGGFVPVPGSVRKFMLGEEIGPSRRYWWVELPP